MLSRRRDRSRASTVVLAVVLAAALAPLARPAAVRAAPPSGPIAEWTFDETTGSTAHDSASTHDGTLLGNPVWSPAGGHDGSGALVFDGAGDGVQVPTAAALEPGSVSVSLWMKGGLVANGQWSTIVQKGANACEAGSYGLLAYGLYDGDTPGLVQARVETSTTGNYAGTSSPGARIWDGQWHLIAWTFDSVANVGKLYVDGIASDTQVTPLLYGLPTASDLFIGHEPTDCGDTRDFEGSLDDVRIYDRALAASEITAQVGPISTETSVSVVNGGTAWGSFAMVNAEVTPAPVESTVVRIYDVTGGGHALVGVGGTSPSTGRAAIQVQTGPSGLDVGNYHVVAETAAIGPFQASTSGEATLFVEKISTNVAMLTANVGQVTPGGTVQLTGSVSGYTDGTATFYEDHGGGNLESLGTAPLEFSNGPYVAVLQTPALATGSHTFLMRTSETAHFTAEESNPFVVTAAEVQSVVILSVSDPRQAHHPLTLEAAVFTQNSTNPDPEPTGMVTFRDGATVLGTVDLAVTRAFVIASPTVGAHVYSAEYAGDGFYLPDTSDPAEITIVADTVDASGLAVQYTTFYPYKDGYRDTNAIKGTRLEPLSVAIKVYNPSNSVVRSASYARASGAYSYVWNGRNSLGAVLPAGKYRIVQTLTDAFGTKKSWTLYAYVSAKKLVTHSTYVTKYAYPPAASSDGGTGAGYYSSTSKYLKLVAGSDGFVLAGWQFALPSATVYKSLKFQVYAKSPASPFNQIGAQNFSWCALSSTWYADCFDHFLPIRSSTTAWYSTSLSPTYNRTGRTVRGMIAVEYGTVYVYKVRVYVSYATLQ
jgi:hypothetical protein